MRLFIYIDDSECSCFEHQLNTACSNILLAASVASKLPTFPLVLKYEKKQLVSSALTPINSSQATINTEIQAAQLVHPEATPEILLLMSVGFVM